MVFCFMIGTEIKRSFEVTGDDKMTISKLREIIYEKIKNNFKSIDANSLDLWKVDIPGDTANVKLKTLENRPHDINNENIIIKEIGGEELSPFSGFGDIFTSSSKNIHIIVQPPLFASTGNGLPLKQKQLFSSMHIIPNEVKIEIKDKVIKTFSHINAFSIDQLVDALALIWYVEAGESDSPDPQNDPCLKLKMEPSFFKISLPGTITEHSLTTIDLCLPSYESKSGMNYLNPFYDDPQFKETVSLVHEKLTKHNKDIIVLAGVSGGGKTSTAFGISLQHWTIYVDFSPYGGQYGDFMGQELERIRARTPKYGQTEEQSKEKISTQKEWLFTQLQMDIKKIQMSLVNVDNISISSLIYYINECLGVKSLILIFDEAQVLCDDKYGNYDGSSLGKTWNLLQAYIAHLTHLPVKCIIAGTYMHMASGISLVTSIGKVQSGSQAHIVLKLPFLTQNDVLRNLDIIIDMRDVTPETRNYLGFILRGRPRNCASFVQMLISKRESKNRTKDQEMRELLPLWYEKISNDMGVYLENACKSLGANYFNLETAIIDVIRLRVFYNYKFKHAIELLKHSIIPCQSPECIILSRDVDRFNEIQINPSLESYLVSGIEIFLKKRGKTLVDVFVEYIIRLNNTSSIGNEFDAVFISVMIEKRGRRVREVLNEWKNSQEFNLPSWITPTMMVMTISNLSGGVPIVEYVENTTHYRSYAIQPDRFSGLDVVISFADDEQNVVLLSASCTISGEPINRGKIKEQVFKSCMKFQYMENPKKKNSQIEDQKEEFSWKEPEHLQIGFGDFLPSNEEVNSEEEEVDYDQDLNYDDLDYDLDYTKNTKNYRISKVSERIKNHERIKSSTENRKHIYVLVELPHRAGKRSKLFRFNKYGDLVIIVDDRNMESVFGPVIKKLMEKIHYKENQENSMNKEDLMDETE
ncbi:17720_t:CDS:2 [Funneliformis geosporum]|uniref:17720_t:CDS:1 n=1 Tax=Funneliformis geosporum TaxID=1117311 RepID=A0A9W4SY77_9GLOM|nr:17720_t:CDS:2 [Funneliformis geosporum]